MQKKTYIFSATLNSSHTVSKIAIDGVDSPTPPGQTGLVWQQGDP